MSWAERSVSAAKTKCLGSTKRALSFSGPGQKTSGRPEIECTHSGQAFTPDERGFFYICRTVVSTINILEKTIKGRFSKSPFSMMRKVIQAIWAYFNRLDPSFDKKCCFEPAEVFRTSGGVSSDISKNDAYVLGKTHRSRSSEEISRYGFFKLDSPHRGDSKNVFFGSFRLIFSVDFAVPAGTEQKK